MPEFDRRAFLPRPPYVRTRDERAGESGYEERDAEALPAGGREGLPPSFHMRADEHYVDYITSAGSVPLVQLVAVRDIDGARPIGAIDLGPLVESVASLGVIQPLLVRRRLGRYELITGSKRLAAAIAAGLTEVPCLLQEVDDARAQELADAENLRFDREEDRNRDGDVRPGLPLGAAREIIDSLATIESSLNLFLDRERPLRERVAAGLVRLESRRARWLAEAYGLLGAVPAVARRTIRPARLVFPVLESLDEEARLAGVELALAVDETAGVLLADERLMTLALTGVARAMLGLLEGTRDAALAIRLGTHPATRWLTFQFSQDLVAAPEGWLVPSSGGALPAEAVGHADAPWLAVAMRVMHSHGGGVEIAAGPEGGCTVTLTLPAA